MNEITEYFASNPAYVGVTIAVVLVIVVQLLWSRKHAVAPPVASTTAVQEGQQTQV